MDLAKLNEIIKANKDSSTPTPYFLLLLTPHDPASNSINVQAANQTSEALSVEDSFTKHNKAPLTKAIENYIDGSTLNTIYNPPPSPAVNSPEQIIKSILEHFKISTDYTNTVDTINASYGITLQKTAGSGDADNADGGDEVTLTDLLNANTALFNSRMPLMPGGSSRSRSMKNRRRHKRRHNTKRRNRK